jgi:hypothetical protein
MAKARTNPKKEIQAYIFETLGKTLEKVKEGMSEKKFTRNIKKASKLIADDFKLVEKKKEKPDGKKKEKTARSIETAP